MVTYSEIKNKYIDEHMIDHSYPKKTDFMTMYVYSKGNLLFKGDNSAYSRWLSTQKNRDFVVEKSFDEDSYKEALKFYNENETKIFLIWKNKIFEEVGADMNNEAHNAIWNYVYDKYHSTIDEVQFEFDELFDAMEKYICK